MFLLSRLLKSFLFSMIHVLHELELLQLLLLCIQRKKFFRTSQLEYTFPCFFFFLGFHAIGINSIVLDAFT